MDRRARLEDLYLPRRTKAQIAREAGLDPAAIGDAIACAPAPTAIATQLYSQATMTKMIARRTQQGESIDQAIAWASGEIEGFMRG